MDVLLSQNGPYITVWAVMYARACLLHGDYDNGLRVLASVQARVQSGERWVEAEYLRLQANFTYSLGLSNPEVFLQTLEDAHSLSCLQGSLIFVDDILQDISSVKFVMTSNMTEYAK
jgi:hypothetical protein